VKGTPILVVIGDNAKEHPRWKNIRQNSVTYAEAFRGRRAAVSSTCPTSASRATRT
jgi:hypothetical protein